MSSRRERKRGARAVRLQREAELRAAARRERRFVAVSAVVLIAALLASTIAVATSGTHTASLSSLSAGDLKRLAVLGKLSSPGSSGALRPEGCRFHGLGISRALAPEARVRLWTGSSVSAPSSCISTFTRTSPCSCTAPPRRIPYGVGIKGAQVATTPAGPFVGEGTCFYWLHTHAADGIIHAESPVARTFTLGDFFDVWGQKLGPAQIGPSAGPVSALLNGRVYRGDPRDIPLTAHAQIRLEVVGPLIGPVSVAFPAGL